MISRIHIQNFRSINLVNLELGKITVLTGANNSGKSSILYGLMILQDFLRNPNRTLEDLFALPFINLGGFEDVKSKFDKESDYIELGLTASINTSIGLSEVQYKLFLGLGKAFIKLKSESGPFSFAARLSIGLPYFPNPQVDTYQEAVITALPGDFVDKVLFGWNGFRAVLNPNNDVPDELQEELLQALHGPVLEVSATDFAPIARGFTKPYYNLVPMRGIIQTEEEVATLLKSDERCLEQVNVYLRQIAGRELDLPTNGAPGLFSMLSKNTVSGQVNFLVNEGSGTNQVVTILAKTFQPDKKFICIDEPEIHLHPSMVRKLAAAFTDMVKEDAQRQFLISTHSEHFVQALLEKVAMGAISPADVKVYHLSMTDTGTAIEHQEINAKGQLEGGLSHFFAEELEGLKSIFKLVD